MIQNIRYVMCLFIHMKLGPTNCDIHINLASVNYMNDMFINQNVGNVFTSNNMLVVLFTTAAVISVQGRQGETIW